jgi:hypothetical protein
METVEISKNDDVGRIISTTRNGDGNENYLKWLGIIW